MVFNFHIFMNFLVFLLLFVSDFISLWLEKILVMISVFLNMLRLFIGLTCDQFWETFHLRLRGILLFLFLDGVFCICLLGLTGLYYWSSLFPHLSFVWLTYLLSNMKSPITTASLCIFFLLFCQYLFWCWMQIHF